MDSQLSRTLLRRRRNSHESRETASRCWLLENATREEAWLQALELHRDDQRTRRLPGPRRAVAGGCCIRGQGQSANRHRSRLRHAEGRSRRTVAFSAKEAKTR